MTFFAHTHKALHEVDAARLSRAAAAGDAGARIEMLRQRLRRSTVPNDRSALSSDFLAFVEHLPVEDQSVLVRGMEFGDLESLQIWLARAERTYRIRAEQLPFPGTAIRSFVANWEDEGLLDRHFLRWAFQRSGLKGLVLARAPMPPLSLEPISYLTQLERLSLPGTAVEDLSYLSGLSKLRDLNLADTLVKDLRPLRNLQNLQELYLGDSRVEGLRALDRLSSLKIVEIAGTPAAQDPAEVERFRLMHPRCEVWQ